MPARRVPTCSPLRRHLSAEAAERIGIAMNVGIIDVGSNTIRLLLASVRGSELRVLEERTAWIRLGADISSVGAISEARLDAAAEAVAGFAGEARRRGCLRLETLVASPGRQAENGSEFLRRLEAASQTRVRVLRRDEEARLAYEGAVSSTRLTSETVAVCDVGGGSTQLAVGIPGNGPTWLRSIDIGSLRLTAQAFEQDPPGKKAVAAARRIVREQFDGLVLPLPKEALVVGGSARGLRRLLGTRTLGVEQLEDAVRQLRKRPAADVADEHGIDPERARTLLAGALILSEAQLRLAVPLVVGRGGVREGAVLALAAQQLSAA
jgi:exopolyphosphatase/guanosine-5'-triphosphate,3'-diphosphate pyrophosphatase